MILMHSLYSKKDLKYYLICFCLNDGFQWQRELVDRNKQRVLKSIQLQIWVNRQLPKSLIIKLPNSTYMLNSIRFFRDEQEASALSIRRHKESLTLRAQNRRKILGDKRSLRPSNNDSHQDQPQEQQHAKDEMRYIVSQKYPKEVILFKKSKFDIEDFSKLAKKLLSPEILQKIQGAIGITKIISQDKMAIDRLYQKEGLIKELVTLSQQTQQLQLQLEAAWSLANLASGSQYECTQLMNYNLLPVISKILRSEVITIVEQGAWIVGNLSCDSKLRDMLLNQGVMQIMVNYLREITDKSVVTISAWALANLSRGLPLPSYSQVAEGVATLCRLLALGSITNSQTFVDCCWAISYHCDSQKKRHKCVLQTNLFSKLIGLLFIDNDNSLVMPCMRIIGNMLIGSSQIVQKMLQFETIPALEKHLYSQRKIIRRQACWCLSNIAASKLKHVQQIFRNTTLMRRLLEMLENDEQEVKVEVVAILCNMCNQESLAVDELIINADILPIFQELLESPSEKTVKEMLKFIEYPLRLSSKRINSDQTGSINENLFARELQRHQISNHIQQLQYHLNDQIYELSSSLLEKYFELEDPLTRPFRDTENNRLKHKIVAVDPSCDQ